MTANFAKGQTFIKFRNIGPPVNKGFVDIIACRKISISSKTDSVWNGGKRFMWKPPLYILVMKLFCYSFVKRLVRVFLSQLDC